MELRGAFVSEVKGIIEQSRVQAIRSVDYIRVRMYWELGRKIVEEEQYGNLRAQFGAYLLEKLSKVLTAEFGDAFRKRQLERYRQFYSKFPIAAALRPQLNWTQYKLILRIDNQSKREFYEAETVKNHWSSRQLERQINSQLYERLLLSSKPEDVLSVASKY